MSAGGVFKLLASDGRSDRMIHATDLLNARIRDIMCQRKAHGLSDVTPTLADIEKTHILFVNAHYKPFAALAYEYTKVRAQSGTITWGGQILFSIPAYGEFFSDMVAHIKLGRVECSKVDCPAFPARIGTAIPGASLPVGTVIPPTQQWSETLGATTPLTPNRYVLYIQEYVDDKGVPLVPTGFVPPPPPLPVVSEVQNYVRYCEYPGEMLFKEVKFEINGNPLDTYTREATMFYRKFWVLNDKEVGWKRLVGQEVPVEAYSNNVATTGASVYTSPMDTLTDPNGDVIGVTSTITARKVVQIVSGPQTAQSYQPELDLWIPLLFWFNKDIRLAIPSVSIPYGQRFITVTLESQDNVVMPAAGGYYLKVTAETRLDVGGAGTGTMLAVGVYDVKRQVIMIPQFAPGSVVNQTQSMIAELYVNNIFVNPEIHDIYIRRIGFTLVRVHRLQKQQITASNDNILLSQLKWPTELIYVGMLPTFNIDALSNPYYRYRDWHNLTRVHNEEVISVSKSSGAVQTVLANPWVPPGNPAALNTAVQFSSEFDGEHLIVPIYQQTIDSLKVTVQGNDIIDTFATPFFRDYTPWYYGQNIMRTPSDLGALLINFCVYPGHYQPSGHINISRAREFYVQYVSSYCSTGNPCEFIALGIALNFLLISDGSAVLRFTS